MRRALLPFCLTLTASVFVPGSGAQQALPPAQAVASAPTDGVTLRGALSVTNGRATLGNNGEVAALEKAVPVSLERGGNLLVCPSTAVRIARDASPHAQGAPGDAGLLFSLDRGAFEAHYQPGAYSDVILTPDLRLLVSAPGQANLKLRVNPQGDTCVENAGENAPYVIASSLMDGGAYRVQPGQRVLFVHGSLREVVDNEREPCGCPPAAPATETAKSGGPSSTPADTAFPTAVSEGLQAPPKLPGSAPIVPNGQPHAQVTATLSSAAPPGPPPAAAVSAAPAPAPASPPPKRSFFGSLGHLFGRIFGAGS